MVASNFFPAYRTCPDAVIADKAPADFTFLYDMIFTECLFAGSTYDCMIFTKVNFAHFTDPAMDITECSSAFFTDRIISLADFKESQLEMMRTISNGILQFFPGAGKDFT